MLGVLIVPTCLSVSQYRPEPGSARSHQGDLIVPGSYLAVNPPMARSTSRHELL